MTNEEWRGLFDRARCGDEAAVKELYRTYSAEARRALETRLAGNPVGRLFTPSDVIQSTFLDLLQRADLLADEVDNIAGYVRTATNNKVVEKARWIGADIRDAGREVHGDAVEHLTDRGAETPSAALKTADEYRHVMLSLSPTDRLFVEARLNGLTFEELGAPFGMSEDAARMKFNRLICALKERFRREE